MQAWWAGQPRRCHCQSGSASSIVALTAAGWPARSISVSACAVARAAVAAASTVSHACGTVSGPPAPPACARMRGQAGSLAVLLRSRQRTQADRPGRTSGPTTPMASSACVTRCGTRCLVSSASTTGSGRPVSTARSGSRPGSSAVRTSRATRWMARAIPTALPPPTSARPAPPGEMSAGVVVPASTQLTHATPDAARNVATHPPSRPAP
ncbi:MAG TPA: hypothetical protein VHZ33_00620 [Trebonia sp.]|nr:hypothetical protein [Trebonia sp.]